MKADNNRGIGASTKLHISKEDADELARQQQLFMQSAVKFAVAAEPAFRQMVEAFGSFGNVDLPFTRPAKGRVYAGDGSENE